MVYLHRLIHGHHASATDTDVMLQCSFCTFHLTFVTLATQLADQLKALSQTSCSQRVTFGQQSTGWVGYDLATVSVLTVENEFLGSTFWSQTQRFVGNQLV